jgi:hypothetical protein
VWGLYFGLCECDSPNGVRKGSYYLLEREGIFDWSAFLLTF